MKTIKKLARFIIDRYIMFKWRRRKVKIANNFSSCKAIKDFSINGVVKINYDFSEFADYLMSNYMNKILNKEKTPIDIFTASTSQIDKEENGLIVSNYLSLLDPKIVNFILNDKLKEVLEAYYGREYFLRNNPTLQQIIAKKENWGTSVYHNDRFHQVSLMLLLSDLKENDTYMEYLCGTHKLKFYETLHPEPDQSKFNEKIKKCNNRFKLIGKKGTAFLFDSIGIHRTIFKLNNVRNILHLNFTTGHNLYDFHDKKLDSNLLTGANSNIIKRENKETYYVENYPQEKKNRYLNKYFNIWLG